MITEWQFQLFTYILPKTTIPCIIPNPGIISAQKRQTKVKGHKNACCGTHQKCLTEALLMSTTMYVFVVK